MEKRIRKILFKALFFYCITFVNIIVAQAIDQIPNQPDLDYYWWKDRSNENLYFLKYSMAGASSQSSVYAFDGSDFDLLPYDEDLWNNNYVGAYTSRDYFVAWPDEIETLYEYNNSQILEYELEEPYTTFTHLATFNNKIYFAALPSTGGYNQKMVTFDGNEVNTIILPETLSGGNNSYFSSQFNKLFLRFGLSPLEYELWTYDGSSFNITPNTTNYRLFEFEIEFNNQLIMSYFDPNATSSDVFHLQKYDGSNLSLITSPNNSSFVDIIGVKENKLFLRYEDIDTGNGNLYWYDGTVLSPISTSPEIDLYEYSGEVNGNDYFIAYKYNTMTSALFSYDGDNLTEISGPSGFSAFYSAGSLGEATLVPNMPENLEIKWFITSFPETLFYSFESDSGHISLFGFNNSEFIEFEFPDTFSLNQYEFTINNKAYFSYGSDILQKVKLFRIDESLALTEIEQYNEDILIYPNPVNDYINIYLNSIANVSYIEVNLYATDGRLIHEKVYNQNSLKKNILYEVNFLNSGLYILEIKNNNASVRKKIIKK